MVENNQENKKKKTLKIDTSKLSSNLSKKLSNVGLSGNESTEKKNNVTVVVKRKHKAPEATNLDNFSKERSDIFNKDDLEHKKKLIKQASRSSLLEQKSNLVKEIEPQEIHAEQVSEEDFANINVNIKEHLEIEKTSEIAINQEKIDETTASIDQNNVEKQTLGKINNQVIAPKDKESEKILFNENKKAKTKYDINRKGKKIDIRTLGEDGEEEKMRSLSSIKRAQRKAKMQRQGDFNPSENKQSREVILPELITISDLAARMAEKATDVIKELIKLGVMVNVNQTIDADTAELVIETLGHKAKRVTEADVENILTDYQDDPSALEPRSPVVTVMGHVDHGKTSLLDALKSTDIVSKEAGGITQHIGAYQVKIDNAHHITFLDTPGHEAFTAMRSRGAKATDIVVLVVAADDGIKAQTVEAINHAKAAQVPIIVAVNKIDKPEADVERVKNELLSHDLVPEEFGGEIIVVPVSAKARTNLSKLTDAILLQAEMLELKANPKRDATGVVIESSIDRGRGVLATLLVQKGTLRVGDLLVAGATYGKVRLMHNDKGKKVDEATISMPVEILGLNDAPVAGDEFAVVKTDKQARDISAYRERKLREKKNLSLNKATSIEQLFIQAGQNIKELALVIKTDVHGSAEAISASLQKIEHPEVKIKILHCAVGAITDSDITLAQASNAFIMGFNVRANSSARSMIEQNNIEIRYYSIIYNLIDDVRAMLSGLLSPEISEKFIGNAEIREVFNITKMGKIAGCYVTNGVIKRGAGVRLLRDNVVIHEGKLKTLRRFKENVKEVRDNFECGVAFENYDDIKVGDVVEAFEIVETKKEL